MPAEPTADSSYLGGRLAVYGAFIGGLVGGFLAAWRSHLEPWPLLDIAAPSMLVGQGIGRLGCPS